MLWSILWKPLFAEFIQHHPQTDSRFCLTSAEESAVLRAVCTQSRFRNCCLYAAVFLDQLGPELPEGSQLL